MRKLLVLLAVGLLALAVSCETLNVGSGRPEKGPQIASITSPTNAEGNGMGTFTVTWTGGTGPYTVVWTFSGCTTPLTYTQVSATTTDTLTVTFDNIAAAQTCNVTVRVTDSTGLFDEDSSNFPIAVTPNIAPVLTATANNAACSIVVGVTDADGDTVSVTATAPAGMTVNGANPQNIADGASATFTFSAADLFAGANGTVDFSGDDGNGGIGTTSTALTCAGITLAADTIYAIPISSSVATGAPVRIVVASGTPANPFLYMNGARVTAPAASGFEYVANSFNVGAVGGAADFVDGIWTSVSPTGFLLAPDNFITEVDAGGGLTGVDFNVTPLGGTETTTGSGALFNFEATFTGAGTHTLNFQETNVVSRTYYQDNAQATDYFWGDSDNSNNGTPNSVTVN